MASGDTPDLICCSPTQDMIDNGKFVDLTNESFWSQLNPAVKQFCTDVKSGKAYNVAALQGAVGIYYNKKIFSDLGLKPANTWADFVSNLKTIKDKKSGIIPFYMGGKDGWMLSHLAEFTFEAPAKQTLSYVDQQKAMLGNDLKSLGWDASATGPLAMFAADLMDLQKQGLLNDNVVTATYDDQTTAFATGKAAVISQGLWAAGDIQKKASDTSWVGFCQYPAIVDGAKPAIGSTVDCQFYISADSKNVDAAKKVLNTILSADNMKAISEARQAPSSNPSVQSNWGYLKADVGAVLSDANIANVTWTAMPSGFSGDDNGRVIQELLAGKYATAGDFATAWVNDWNAGFSK
jgi:raffinose/stachyose/melibiose transport system substrate-binding protein